MQLHSDVITELVSAPHLNPRPVGLRLKKINADEAKVSPTGGDLEGAKKHRRSVRQNRRLLCTFTSIIEIDVHPNQNIPHPVKHSIMY